MIYQVVAVRDDVNEQYQNLNLEISEPAAVRNFVSALMSAQSRSEGLFFSHPEDFSLWNLGEFDSETGVFQNFQPRLLKRGESIHA